MRLLGVTVTILIVLFWTTMNSLLVRRQLEESELGLYQQKVRRFLDSARHRERWLSIYLRSDRRNRQVGYTGTIVDAVQGPNGTEYHTRIESMVDVEVFGRSAVLLKGLIGTGDLRIDGLMVQDGDMRPLHLTVELTFPNERRVVLQGERKDDRFILKAHHEDLAIPPLSMPLEKMTLGNSLAPDLPLAGLKEGEKFRVKMFDPVFFASRPVDVEVVSLGAQEHNGVLVDVYTLESTYRGFKTTSIVTRDGTVLRIKLGPPFQGISLQYEKSAESARRIVPRKK